MSVFKEYSAYYDLLYKDKDYEGEVEYLIRLIRAHTRSARSILNLGCGTGKHDYLLAKRGYEVVGIDLSPHMIDIAKSKLAKSDGANLPEFYQGDILSLALNKKFDVVVSLFHVMSYQTSNEALELAFANAFDHLNDEGVFIFDCWYGPGVLTDLPHYKEKILEDDSYHIKRTSVPVMHANENCVDVRFGMSILDKESGKNFELEEIHKMRYLFYPEILLISERQKFEILNAETWMSGTPLTYSSWNAVFICKKT